MDYASFLRSLGLKATPQRLAILQILDRHEHPSVAEIYEQIKQKINNISQATIYKNITAMLQSGAVVEITAPGMAARYDIYAQEHAHLLCENCRAIYDIPALAAGMDGFSAQLAAAAAEHGQLGDVMVFARIKNCKRCLNA